MALLRSPSEKYVVPAKRRQSVLSPSEKYVVPAKRRQSMGERYVVPGKRLLLQTVKSSSETCVVTGKRQELEAEAAALYAAWLDPDALYAAAPGPSELPMPPTWWLMPRYIED